MSTPEDVSLVDVARLLSELSLFTGLDPSAVAEIAAECRRVDLPAGAILFHQGDPGDSLYVIAQGRIGVRMQLPDGTSATLDTHGPGVSVGEMGLITGQPRVATVYAEEPSMLFQLSQSAFEQLAASHPSLVRQLSETSVPRIMRTQLADALTNLFGPLEQEALHELQASLEWLHLAPGEELFTAGSPNNGCYIVINGRLASTTTDDAGTPKLLNEIGRGECVGETALLTEEPHSTTVYAIRESNVVRLSRERFHHLIEQQPRALLQISRLIARRARSLAEGVRRRSEATTFTLIPAGPEAPLADLARRLADALAHFGPTLLLDAARVDAELSKHGAAQTTDHEPTSLALLGWLNQRVAAHRYVIFVADPTWSEWTRRCIRQADRLLIVGRAGSDPAPGPIEQALVAEPSHARSEIVLIQPDSAERPRGTAAWLDRRELFTHHHVRMGNPADLDRLARRLSGRAIGLVLGGGGARGYVHLGAIKALDEAGISIDMIAGTSMGALLGAGRAIGYSHEEMLTLAGQLSNRKKIVDITLPLVSFAATRNVTEIYRRVYGDTQIEDLWQPFCCVSSNISSATPHIHTRGALWEAIRASSSIPGLFAPFLHASGDILVDGGVMNNFPLDVMRDSMEAGTVIGVSASPSRDRSRTYNFGPSVSGWRILASRLGIGKRIRAPSLFGGIMRTIEINSVYNSRSPAFRRLADLIIQPPVEQFRILDFDSYRAIVDLGYEAAREQIAAWRTAATTNA